MRRGCNAVGEEAVFRAELCMQDRPDGREAQQSCNSKRKLEMSRNETFQMS